jgi:hypothetical protein|tara:strand:+ start:247 stop:420 length:174 start_codon:yes stop_codon:yes gene_type:complete
MVNWNLILKRKGGDVTVGFFKTKREAENELSYRYELCEHLGYSPDLTYEIKRGKPKK